MKRLLPVALICLLLPVSVCAQEPDPLPDKFSLAAGGFLIKYTRSFVAFDVEGSPLGTAIDLADDLNQNASNRILRMDGYFRFSPRHRLDMSWFRFSREGSARLEKSLQIGPQQFGVGTDLDSKTVTNLIKFGYTYSFYHVEQVELGVGVGFHLINMNFDANATERTQEVSEGGLIPLPNLGLTLDYMITPRLHVPAQFQFFFIEIGDYRGSMTDIWFGLEYRAFRNFGLGIAYNRFVLEAEARESNFSGFANTTFNGFQLYLVGKF